MTDDQIAEVPFYRPAEDSIEMEYLRERRAALAGSLPQRRRKSESLEVPPLSAFDAQLKGSDDREVSTTMAFVRILRRCCATRISAAASCRLSPTNRAPSAWKGCFVSSESSRRSASSISPKIPDS